jgi:hypothetical protein
VKRGPVITMEGPRNNDLFPGSRWASATCRGQQPLDKARRIARAAVTTATRSLTISYSKDSALVERLADA